MYISVLALHVSVKINHDPLAGFIKAYLENMKLPLVKGTSYLGSIHCHGLSVTCNGLLS